MKTTVTRRLEIDAGHRLLGHESKCAHLHGHRYVIEVEARSEALDSIGRVVDFSVIKERLGTWLDKWWDHGMILNQNDIELIGFCVEHAQKYHIMSNNPTAENMAQFLLRLCPQLFDDCGIVISKVTIWETPNCKAEASL